MAALAVAGALFGLAAMPALAGAATITPNTVLDEFTDNATCSLREAIEIANDNSTTGNEADCQISGDPLVPGGPDTISLTLGSPYQLSIPPVGASNDNADGDLDAATQLGGNLTIDGAGATATTIGGSGAVGFGHRILEQINLAGLLTITDLTISNGNDALAADVVGAGIASQGPLSISRTRFTGNTATGLGGGGAIFAAGSSFTLTESTIDANSGNVAGGGIVISGGTSTISGSVVADNTVGGESAAGGGLYALDGSLTIEDSLFDNNHADADGATGTPVGGGIRLSDVTATIRRTTIARNDVTDGVFRHGAGLAVDMPTSGDFDLINSTVSGNDAPGSGPGSGGDFGGMRISSGTPTIGHVINSTFVGNTAGAASPISALGGTGMDDVEVRGSILVGFPGDFATCSQGVVSSGGFNVVDDNSCNLAGTPGTGDEVNVPDLMLGALLDNGGPDAGAPGMKVPVPTHDIAASSTAVDHVPAAMGMSCVDESLALLLTVDQRGFMRPQDGDDPDAIAQCDAGALERQPPAPPPPPPPPPPSDTPPTLTPTPTQVAENPACAALRAKLKKAKSKRKKRRIRRQLRALGC
jgi:CSLREA domain-containing protein